MAIAGNRAARVSVSFAQYWVVAGPDVGGGDGGVPGLFLDLGPQAVAVLTGLQDGRITVTATALRSPPAELGDGWDVAAETDLYCPEGVISVCDWGGPCHGGLGPLAIDGPGRYRLRVQARNRRPVSQRQSTEEHHLLVWPVSDAAPPRLLTPLDECGRLLTGERPADDPGLDDLDRAASAAVRRLAELAARPAAPQLSGQLTVVRAGAIAPATARRVWNELVVPWGWAGSGGGGGPAGFDVYIHNEPRLEAHGRIVTEEPPAGLAFTWWWTAAEVAPQWVLPPDPTTVSIQLRRHGKGTTDIGLCHRDLPTELAGDVQPFWDWALRALCGRLGGLPFYGRPWDR